MVILAGDASEAEELQGEVLAALGSDLDGLKRGLTNYGPYMAVSRGGVTKEAYTLVDFIKDTRLLKSRLEVELKKITKDKQMRSMLSFFPTKELVLHKQNETTAKATALVDDYTIHSDDVDVIINVKEAHVKAH